MQPLALPSQLKEFLASETVCCLAVALSKGEVHVAPLLFWCDQQNLCVYMSTAKNSEKMWWWREGKPTVSASIAIGLTKKLPYGLQMRGTVQEFNLQDNPVVTKEYAKVASQLDSINNPNNVMIAFYPTWARYTDRSKDYATYQIDV